MSGSCDVPEYPGAARARQLSSGAYGTGAVVYWMSRDQRARDNWALLFAQALARRQQRPLTVVFCLAAEFLGATLRQYAFMLSGLAEVRQCLRRRNIGFVLLVGEPPEELLRFIVAEQVCAVVADFDPLRIKQQWRQQVAACVPAPMYEVDTHNIVPAWILSPKQEYSARTLRLKLNRLKGDYLTALPSLRQHEYAPTHTPDIDWRRIEQRLRVERGVAPVDWIVPGEAAAAQALDVFVKNRLSRYHLRRNDPTVTGTSRLSAYIHFGQLAAQRVALRVAASAAPEPAKDAFLEELLVRRELADNYCFYQPSYDTIQGIPRWAKETLARHSADQRPALYSREDFSAGRTHDPLWNAAQRFLTGKGWLHGYLRMYWAKKLLEWSPDPETAFTTAVWLNDRYQLDGRDPNGYAGIAWSIGGVHDRPWPERAVFGCVRAMSLSGCRKKFPVDRYIQSSV